MPHRRGSTPHPAGLFGRSLLLVPALNALILLAASAPAADGGADCPPSTKIFVYHDGRFHGLSLWRSQSTAKQNAPEIFFRKGDVQVWRLGEADPSPAGEPRYENASDACPSIKKPVDEAVDASEGQGGHPKVDLKTALEAKFKPFPTGSYWNVREDDEGFVLSQRLDGAEPLSLRFDCLKRLLELLEPAPKRLIATSEPINDTLTITADVRKTLLGRFLNAELPVCLFTSTAGSRASEQLLVRRERDRYKVLWLPLESTKPWNAHLARQAFGDPQVHELPAADYERVRSMADVPGNPDTLNGLFFAGFERHPDQKVVLYRPLAWKAESRPAATRVWELKNRYQALYAPNSVPEKIESPATLAIGPSEFRFGVAAEAGPVVTKPGDETTLVGGTYYPVSFDARLTEKVQGTFRLVNGQGVHPFYLMDEEFRVRQLVSILLLHDLDTNEWWRTADRRDAKMNKAMRLGSGGPLSDKGSPGDARETDAKSNGDDRPRLLQAQWGAVHRLANRIAQEYSGLEGNLEPIYAAWLFHETLADVKNLWKPLLDPKTTASGPGASQAEAYDNEWLSRRGLYQVDSLLPYFRLRSFAWAECGWASERNARSGTAAIADKSTPTRPDLEPGWNAFHAYCWKTLGTEFAVPEEFERAFEWYREARLRLVALGTDLGSAAVCPLDDPVTHVSLRSVREFLANPTPTESGAKVPQLRLPTPDEWSAAARPAWLTRLDANGRGAPLASPAVGCWTGDRLRPWPLKALGESPGFQDRTGNAPGTSLWNLIGNACEFVDDKQPSFIGACYRTELDGPESGWESSYNRRIPVAEGLGWSFVGFRPALALAAGAGSGTPEAPGSAGGPPASKIPLSPTESNLFDKDQPLGQLYRAMWGTDEVRGRTGQDPIQEVWQLEVTSVAIHLGARRIWWVEDYRASVWGAATDDRLQAQWPVERFLKEMVKREIGR
jgi:hypothetical protein